VIKARAPKIHGITVKSFREIRDELTLDFRTPVGTPANMVVIAGPNGSGKTSVLEAILLALGQPDKVDKPSSRLAWRRVVPQETTISVDVSFDGDPVERHSSLVPEPLEIEYFSSWQAPDFVGVGTSQSQGRLKQRISDEKIRAAFCGEAGRASQWLSRINEAWQILRHDDTRLDVQLVDPNADDLLADLFLLRGDERICSIDRLGQGELRLFTIAATVVMKELTTGVVLIDEPELHFHPEWQGGIFSVLRHLAPDVQFIIATHSDIIWDRAPEYARFNLKNTHHCAF